MKCDVLLRQSINPSDHDGLAVGGEVRAGGRFEAVEEALVIELDGGDADGELEALGLDTRSDITEEWMDR